MNRFVEGAVCLFLLLHLLPGAALAGEDYEFTLLSTGREIVPTVLSLAGAPEQPCEGDLVEIEDFHLVLGPPGMYTVSFRGSRRERLYIKRAGRGTELIAVVEDGERLARLSRADRQRLRGVRIERYTAETAEALRDIDPTHTAIALNRYARPDGKMPLLDPVVRYLVLRAASFRDAGRVATLPELRALWIRRGDLPLSAVAGAGELRALRLRGDRSPDVSALARLRELRHLDLAYADDLGDLGFLADLPNLAYLNLTGAEVSTLPDLELPALRTFEILPSSSFPRPAVTLSPESVEKFLTRNPACSLVTSWEEVFREAVAAVDRVRVRTGGSCHFDPEKVATLFELTEPEAVRTFLAAIEVVEEASGGGCMCCGEPTFEFYRGKSLEAVLSFHHDHALRWKDGKWPGDATLTPDSRLALGKLLATNGVTEPLARIREDLANREAGRVRAAKEDAVLGEAVAARLDDAQTMDDILEAFVRAVPDPAERGFLLFRLLGSNEDSWMLMTPNSFGLVPEPLAVIEKEAVPDALRLAVEDDLARKGAARWLLGHEGWSTLEAETLEQLLPPFAASALRHPRKASRRWALAVLARIGSPAAVAAIRTDHGAPRPLPSDEDRQDPNWKRDLPDGLTLDLDGTDREAAERALKALAK